MSWTLNKSHQCLGHIISLLSSQWWMYMVLILGTYSTKLSKFQQHNMLHVFINGFTRWMRSSTAQSMDLHDSGTGKEQDSAHTGGVGLWVLTLQSKKRPWRAKITHSLILFIPMSCLHAKNFCHWNQALKSGWILPCVCVCLQYIEGKIPTWS